MNNIVLIDRDGTLIYDDSYHLGHTTNWRSKVRILPGVISGIKKLNKLGVKIYIITNQPGVAVKEFPLLTQKRAEDVCKYVIKKLRSKGAYVDGYFVCGHASPSYVKTKKFTFDTSLVCNCSCIKPNLGMVFSALKNEGLKKKDVKIFVIGDRVSDVKLAIKAKGYGILVPFNNRIKEVDKVKGGFVASSFLRACEFIKNVL